MSDRPRTSGRTSAGVLFLRHGVPAIIVLGGIVLFAVRRDINAADGAAMLIGAGLSWWLMGWLFRQGQKGDVERDAEEAAREFLDRHGRWPTEAESAHFARTGSWPSAGPPAETPPRAPATRGP